MTLISILSYILDFYFGKKKCYWQGYYIYYVSLVIFLFWGLYVQVFGVGNGQAE